MTRDSIELLMPLLRKYVVTKPMKDAKYAQ